ncbi:hypothetical protein HA50_21090 [Pantoea cypripedii]|uniref:Uncharacterized protein n=1 Tax=Pantoea cypripedii TaxID=55209 RepID=A0A1X1EJZ6_PANCY|nr:hypothetical protein HA50_21090 [Pantoea cypripedii]
MRLQKRIDFKIMRISYQVFLQRVDALIMQHRGLLFVWPEVLVVDPMSETAVLMCETTELF